MARTDEEIRVGLELALSEILKVENMNTWIAYKDRPISKILQEAEVDVKYAPLVMKALAKVGLVEEEGERAGKRYIIKSQIIPDIQFLVNKIRQEMKEKGQEYQQRYMDKRKGSEEKANTFDGYPYSKPSDLRQKRAYKRKDAHQDVYSSQPIKQKRQIIIPTLGDMRFAILGGIIMEGKIVSVHYAEDGKSVLYNLEVVNTEWLDWDNMPEDGSVDFDGVEETKKYITIDNVGVKDLFETAEIAANYLVRNAIKYIKR